MLTMAELSELLERNRRRDREFVDRTIVAAARLQVEFDKILEEMRRANNYRAMADRRDDFQKDHDEEERGDYR